MGEVREFSHPSASGTTSSLLDRLREDVHKRAAADKLYVRPVAGMDGYEVVFDVGFRYDEDFERWRKDAKGDELRFSSIILFETCREIRVDGQPITGPDGAPVTFRSDEFVRLLGSVDEYDAIRRFYGGDGHLLKASGGVLRAAGYAPDDETADPTSR